MAVQAHPYLVLTDGTTTITHQDGSGGLTNWPLLARQWAPTIAGRRSSLLAGRTPYADVVETYAIEVRGSTAANALANLASLASLLDQAEAWSRGEAVAIVLVKFAPHGSEVSSTASPLRAAIIGRAPDDQTAGVSLSPEWDEVGRNYVIPRVIVSFVRRGLWLHTEDTDRAENITNGDLATFTMAEARTVLAPTEINIDNFGYGKSTGTRYHGGFVLVGDEIEGSGGATPPIVIINAEGGTATAYTSVTPSGSTNPRNTNVLRYTPTGTGEAFSGTLGTPALGIATKLVALFANVRPSTTVSFQIRARVDSKIYQYTPLVSIPAVTTQYPRWVFLGLAAVSMRAGALDALYLAITASAASSNLDIDTVVICDARAVQVLGIIGPGDGDLNTVTKLSSLFVEPDLDANLDPRVYQDTTGDPPVAYQGDADFMTKADTVYGVLLAGGGGTGANGDEYRQANTSTDAVLANTWDVYRTRAYLVPQ